MNYYVIPMDFNRYSFLDLLKEWRKHRHVIWEAYGEVDNDSNDKPFIKKTSKIARSMEKGDVIYIYVFNLPSVNAKNKARILLRGTVKKRPYPVKRSEACYTDATDDTDDDWIIGFQIENLITLKESNLRNDKFLSREDLKERFDFLNPQGRRWPNTVTGTLHDALVNYLEKRFDDTTDFFSLIDHFNRKCYFSNTRKGCHITFLRRNGTDYFEYHHFIRRNAESIKRMRPFINSPENIVCLCPNCHRLLHSGRPDEVKSMLKELWNDKDVGKKIRGDKLNKAIGVDNDKEAFEWLLGTYYSD